MCTVRGRLRLRPSGLASAARSRPSSFDTRAAGLFKGNLPPALVVSGSCADPREPRAIAPSERRDASDKVFAVTFREKGVHVAYVRSPPSTCTTVVSEGRLAMEGRRKGVTPSDGHVACSRGSVAELARHVAFLARDDEEGHDGDGPGERHEQPDVVGPRRDPELQQRERHVDRVPADRRGSRARRASRPWSRTSASQGWPSKARHATLASRRTSHPGISATHLC